VYQAFYLAFVPQVAELDYPIGDVTLDDDLIASVGAMGLCRSTHGGSQLVDDQQ